MKNKVSFDNYAPPVIMSSPQVKQIAVIEEAELTEEWKTLKIVLDDSFIETLSEEGIKRWEGIMKITPNISDTLKERRYRIKVRYNERLPYTKRRLYLLLTSLCGENGFTLNIEHNVYTVTVKVALTVKKMFEEVKALLLRILPAEMVLGIDLMYNTWEDVHSYTWDELHQRTWEQVMADPL